MPRLLAVADVLVLVAPASAAAARAIGMTFEWLEAHGQADLAGDSIMVMNGVSRRSLPQPQSPLQRRFQWTHRSLLRK